MLNRITNPIKVEDISIKNAEWLEIRYYNKENYYSMAYGYGSLKIIIADGIVYNKLLLL